MSTEPLTVLLVEDNDDIRLLLESALAMRNYRVFAVANGKEAIHLIPSLKEIHIILLDLMMPIMNGWEFLEIRSSLKKIQAIPVVVMSGVSCDKPTGFGITFMPKPVSLSRLFNVLHKIVSEPLIGEQEDFSH